MVRPPSRKPVDWSNWGFQCSAPWAENNVQKRALRGVTNAMTMTVKRAPSANRMSKILKRVLPAVDMVKMAANGGTFKQEFSVP